MAGKRHGPEQIVRKLQDADAMLNAGKDVAAVLQALEVSEATYLRWRKQYGGMKAELPPANRPRRRSPVANQRQATTGNDNQDRQNAAPVQRWGVGDFRKGSRRFRLR